MATLKPNNLINWLFSEPTGNTNVKKKIWFTYEGSGELYTSILPEKTRKTYLNTEENAKTDGVFKKIGKSLRSNHTRPSLLRNLLDA